MSTDEPLQLIRFIPLPNNEEKTEAQIQQEAVTRILQQCGDHPICPVCICGPSRRGKSFILGYMIRYFEALEKEEWDWLDRSNPKKPLSGFRFLNQTEPLTKGIWVWSRPFIVRGPNQEQIAVLLVDTQGTGDEYTTETEMTTIVSLSLLFSSMMIFNFFTSLDDKTLGAFDTYIQYGLLAKENDDGVQKPFQNITFLIRDWNVSHQFSFGLRGGQDYLGELLKLKNGQSKEAQRVRKSIKDCFEQTNCFLMPHIGQDALKPTFTGSISELDPEFVQHLEGFIGSYLKGRNLVKKRILGEVLTAPDFKRYLEIYVKIFNSDEIPQAINVWEATVQATGGNLVAKALKSYVEGMKAAFASVGEVGYLPENLLNEAHTREKSKAQNLFENSKKFGSMEQCHEFEQSLLQLIFKEINQLTTENKMKKTEYILRVEGQAKEEFQRRLMDQFPLIQNQGENSSGGGSNSISIPPFFEAEDITSFGNNVSNQILSDFENKFKGEQDRFRRPLLQKLTNILDESLSSFLTTNEAQKGKAEEVISTLQKQLVTDYILELGGYLEQNEFAEVATLQDIHEKLKSSKIETLISLSTSSSGNQNHQPHLTKHVEKWKTNLKSSLDKEFENQSNSHKLHLNQVSSRMEGLIEESAEIYKQQLETYITSTCESPEDLKSYHEAAATSFLSQFNSEQNPYPDSSPERIHFSDKLEKALSSVFESSELKLDRETRALDDFYRVAIGEGADRYKQQMEEYLRDAGSQQQLEEHHLETLSQQTWNLEQEVRAAGGQNEFLRRANLPRYLEQLEKIITPIFETIVKDFATQHEVARSASAQWKSECKTYYENLMKENLERANDLSTLESFHVAATLEAGELLAEKVTDGDLPHVSFDALAAQLETEMEAKWTEIRKSFEDLQKVKHAETKEVLMAALDHYRREMETHFKNNQFIRPTHLQTFHEAATSVVIAQADANEDENLRSEITSALIPLFKDFCIQNDMNLNVEHKPAIGIDLGTTNCCVSVYKNGSVITIPAEGMDNFKTTPSYVAFNPEGTEVISYGHAAKSQYFINLKTTIFDVKRIIGKSMDDEALKKDMEIWPFTVVPGERGQPMIQIGREENLHTPPGISAILLARLRKSTEEYLTLPNHSIKRAVVTVPAYFDSSQRQATMDAGILAGFDKVDLLTEPVAAAFAYKMDSSSKTNKKVLIYDLGGGTFDISFIDVESGINVLAIGGHKHLGGQDFDRRLMEHCAKEFSDQTKIKILNGDGENSMKNLDARTLSRLRRLQAQCENVKKALSTSTSANVEVDNFYDQHHLNVLVTRKKFEELNEMDFQKTIRIVEDTLNSVNGLKKEHIDDIILVGGSTRIPRVRELLQKCFGGKALNFSVNGDEAVAYGAARQAAILNGADLKKEAGLFATQDVTPMPLGVEIVTKELSVIVPRNAKIPCKHTEVYYTVADNQTVICFKVYQGDKKIAADNTLLGQFTLKGLPKNRAGKEAADVTMEIDAMGILHVSAVSKSQSNLQAELMIKEESLRIDRDQLPVLREQTARLMQDV